MIYKKLIRPVLFLFNPEKIHIVVTWGGELLAKIPVVSQILAMYFRVQRKELNTQVLGMNLENPIGLSAGFDKDAKFLNFTWLFGFGFSEIGSITGSPYEGNTGPHVRRLVRNESLVINYGLKSDGVKVIYERLKKKKSKIPYGISVAKTNKSDCVGARAREDYAFVYTTCRDTGNYYTINLSCPNIGDELPFSNPKELEPLLQLLQEKRNEYHITKPVCIKIGPDISHEMLDGVIELISRYHIEGIVISNLYKDKKRAKGLLEYPDEYNPQWGGGVSGRAVQKTSTNLIRYVYEKTKGSVTIIGVGGVYTGSDAYEKIKAGASLIELITAFIYGGPATVRKINLELSSLLQRDGFASIKDAVGSNVKI